MSRQRPVSRLLRPQILQLGQFGRFGWDMVGLSRDVSRDSPFGFSPFEDVLCLRIFYFGGWVSPWKHICTSHVDCSQRFSIVYEAQSVCRSTLVEFVSREWRVPTWSLETFEARHDANCEGLRQRTGSDRCVQVQSQIKQSLKINMTLMHTHSLLDHRPGSCSMFTTHPITCLPSVFIICHLSFIIPVFNDSRRLERAWGLTVCPCCPILV